MAKALANAAQLEAASYDVRTFGDCALYVPHGEPPYEVICHTDDPEWESVRDEGLGASDTPELFGEGFATQSLLALWAEKSGYGATWIDQEADHLLIGKLVEPAIIDMYRRRSGHAATPCGFLLRSKRYPWITCTLDAQTVIEHDGVIELAPLELKSVSSFAASEWYAEPPARVQLQLQHQMIVTGARFGAIAAFLGGSRFTWHVAPADEFVQLRIVNATRRFWHDYVEKGRQPIASDNAVDAKVLREIYKDSLPPEVADIELPDEYLYVDKAIADATMQKADLEKTIQGGRNMIQQAMGAHTVARLSNGRTWKIDRKGVLRAPKQAKGNDA